MREHQRRLLFFTGVLAWTISAGSPIALRSAQPQTTAARTIWDGVYSEAQADRGAQAYLQHCATCHGANLGGDAARAITGPAFVNEWLEDNVDSLFTRIQSTMPRGAPRSLSGQTYTDIVAHLLAHNGFPVSRTGLELRPGALADIRIQGPDGPKPLPNYALIVTIGCLSSESAGVWRLTDASEPIRTREPEGKPAMETTRAAADSPAGTSHFRLLDVYAGQRPTAGQQVEVRGLLIRTPAEDRISVTGLQRLERPCAP